MKKAVTILLLISMMLSLSACAQFQSGVHDLHGSIIGNEYYIDIFDNTGIRTLRSHGKRIDIDNNISRRTDLFIGIRLLAHDENPELGNHNHN